MVLRIYLQLLRLIFAVFTLDMLTGFEKGLEVSRSAIFDDTRSFPGEIAVCYFFNPDTDLI
jgi:hypothetical protein